MNAACLLAALLVWLHPVAAFTEYGLTGFPANYYDPVCATACLRSLNSLTLNCSSEGVTIGMQTFITSFECFAQNEPFLKSAAWCTHVKCAEADPSASLLEYWWDMQITGQKSAGVQAVPAKWTFGEALSHVEKAPTLQLLPTDPSLNQTSLAPPSAYEAQYNVLYGTFREGRVSNAYAISMLVFSFGLPMVLTALGCLPVVAELISKARPYPVWPSAFGTKHVQSLPYMLGKPPVIGQAIYALLFSLLNIFFTAIGYKSLQPNARPCA